MYRLFSLFILVTCIILAISCNGMTAVNPVPSERKPLVTTMYTADPSAHVFEGKLFIYPSHDLPNFIRPDQWGSQFDMKDYHVFTLTDFTTPAVDNGEALNINQVSWASREMWAPDAAFKDGTYFLYFPAKDKEGIFRIGVATSKNPAGPFVPEPQPIPGSFSIDPAVFLDDDGQAYMYFGGLLGGQLERWLKGVYDPDGTVSLTEGNAIGPRVARLAADMRRFEGPVREAVILDENGRQLRPYDSEKVFFEASWMHKYKGSYYLSYSTGDARSLAYATSKSPMGPFTFRGRILTPVEGWTTHHSIIEFKGKWYLFYHDASISHETYLRCIKYQELHYNDKGDIVEMKGIEQE